MWSFCISSWQAGLRSKSIQSILILGVVLVMVAYFSASFSPRQPMTVALDVGLSGLRLTLVLFALFWVQDLLGKEIERRTVLFALTYPVPRSHYLLGRYCGILCLLALAALLLGMALWLVVLMSSPYEQGFPIQLGLAYWATVAGLWIDAAVVASFALWIASLSTVPMLPLALGLAFAVGGKLLGAVVEYLSKGADGDEKILQMAPLIDTIQKVLPDLSRLDWRAWPMYGVAPVSDGVLLALGMALSYVLVMLALAVITFSRRQFQ